MAVPHSYNTGRESNDISGTATMFNSIAPTYDFLNRFLSAGSDIQWRKKAIGLLAEVNPRLILDVATGTGGMAIMAALKYPDAIVTGVDPAPNMLEIAQEKIRKKNISRKVNLVLGNSENLPFADAIFDAVTVTFGVRNFTDVRKGLAEMHRVLKNEGMVVILEFSMPDRFPVNYFYSIYFKLVLPLAGRIISGHNSAYSYLPSSVTKFPDRASFIAILTETGFRNVTAKPLSAGIVTIYTGIK